MAEAEHTTGTPTRRALAAILITDAVGFSALASRDEARALDLLTADMDAMRASCARFRGRVIKSTGDGLLMAFDSAVEAANCAMDIQAGLAVRPGEGLFQHRLGVHLGDVVMTQDDAYGDGVNVASRLQDGAVPGAVWVSQTVYEVIRGKVACRAVFEGEKAFKGLAVRVPVWSIAPGEGEVGGKRRSLPSWVTVAAPAALVAATVLAIVSIQLRGDAARDVQRAQQERDQTLQMLQAYDNGVPLQEMQFDRLRDVVASSTGPDGKPDAAMVAKLEGLEQWKAWMTKRLSETGPNKPLDVTAKTPEGTRRVVVVHGGEGRLGLKEGSATRVTRLEAMDPEAIVALSEALAKTEDAATRKKIATWVHDYRQLYSFRSIPPPSPSQRTGTARPGAGTPRPGAGTHRPPASGAVTRPKEIDEKSAAEIERAMDQVDKAMDSAGEVKIGETADVSGPAKTGG
jgi:class 3 adenylate cyclase